MKPFGTPELVRPWKLKADVSRCIPAYSEHLPRLFRFSEHVVFLATGNAWPSNASAVDQIRFIAAVYPKIVCDPAGTLVTSPALTPSQLAGAAPDILGDLRGGSGIGGDEELVATAFNAATAAVAGDDQQTAPREEGRRTDAAERVDLLDAQSCCYLRARLADQVNTLTTKVSLLERLLAATIVASATARHAFSSAFRALDAGAQLLLSATVSAWLPWQSDGAAAPGIADPSATDLAAAPVSPATIARKRLAVPHGITAHEAYLLVG